MNRGTPAVAGRASPSHPAEVHAAERFSILRPFTSSWVAAPLRRAGGKIDDGTFSILANRLNINGEVRRLGFAPIPSRRFNSNPGAFRGERAARKIIDAQKLEISRDRKPGQKRVEALPGSCASLCDGTARRSRAGVMTGRARNSFFRTDEFVFMAASEPRCCWRRAEKYWG